MSDSPADGELLPEGSPPPKISPQEIWELEKDKAIARAIQKAIDKAVSGSKSHLKKPVVAEAVKKSLVEVKTLALELFLTPSTICSNEGIGGIAIWFDRPFIGPCGIGSSS